MIDLPTPLASIPDVAEVVCLGGPGAAPGGTEAVLIEVPHGADEPEHYDRLRAELRGDLPSDLDHFFQVNTDVGAWALGRGIAERYLQRHPARSVLLLRSLIPRTFIDCNRPATEDAEVLTPGIPAYVTDPHDRALLVDRHARYVALAQSAYGRVCGRGGFAVIPHTYGPRTMGITKVGADIVEQLHRELAPGRVEQLPLRAEVDLLTREPDGRLLAPEWAEGLVAAFATAGFAAAVNGTYSLHPAALGHRWSSTWRGRVLTFEVRRDLLVEEWLPFAPKTLRPEPIDAVARVIAPALP
jgi:hypothetical protein